jgi:hypothetical protein
MQFMLSVEEVWLDQALKEAEIEPDLAEKIKKVELGSLEKWCNQQFEIHWEGIDLACSVCNAIAPELAKGELGKVIEHRWDFVEKIVAGMQALGSLPPHVKVEEFVANLLLIPEPKPIPPGHKYFLCLGVRDAAGWNRLTPLQQALRYAPQDKTKRRVLHRTAARLVRSWANDQRRHSISDERTTSISRIESDRWGNSTSLTDRERAVAAQVYKVEEERWKDYEAYTDIRLAFEQYISDSPPEQAKAGRLFLQSLDRGVSFRAQCLSAGEDPNRTKANLARLFERVRKGLLHT